MKAIQYFVLDSDLRFYSYRVSPCDGSPLIAQRVRIVQLHHEPMQPGLLDQWIA